MCPILKSCPRHGLYEPTKHGCPVCYRADNKRRGQKQREHGRTTVRWKQLAKRAKQIAGYRCQACGRAEIPQPGGWLSVHLRPELAGNHHAATLDDVVVLCLSCHGTVDAPRAQPRERERPDEDPPPLLIA